jgi:hypothetical protein
MNVVISQPMYFPWCGLINQIKLSDVFIHYDDVQLSRGFYNRIQVKRENKLEFITVPLKNKKQKILINEAEIFYDNDWVLRHRKILEQSFKYSEYKNDAIEIYEKVHEKPSKNLSELSIKSTMEVANYFDLVNSRQFINSSELNVYGHSSERLLKIVKQVQGTNYITGHGALNYLEYDIFEKQRVSVSIMKYDIKKYKQSYGSFTPYLTSLDAIANLGRNSLNILKSSLVSWNDAIINKGLLE